MKLGGKGKAGRVAPSQRRAVDVVVFPAGYLGKVAYGSVLAGFPEQQWSRRQGHEWSNCFADIFVHSTDATSCSLMEPGTGAKDHQDASSPGVADRNDNLTSKLYYVETGWMALWTKG